MRSKRHFYSFLCLRINNSVACTAHTPMYNTEAIQFHLIQLQFRILYLHRDICSESNNLCYFSFCLCDLCPAASASHPLLAQQRQQHQTNIPLSSPLILLCAPESRWPSRFVSRRPKYGITEQRTNYKGVMRLTIRSFSSSDVGTYHCVSTNSLGRAEGTLRLYGKNVFIQFLNIFFFFLVFCSFSLVAPFSNWLSFAIYLLLQCIKPESTMPTICIILYICINAALLFSSKSKAEAIEK